MAEARKRTPKSVITCDLEGRIQTYNPGAQELFGYAPDEVIGKRRVSLFSPGEIVLGHVGKWLEAARREGSFETDTVFLRKDGTPFAAHIRITPTFRKGRQIGYCGVTVPLDRPPEEVAPPIGLGTRIFKWLAVTRAPFLTASLVGLLTGGAAVYGSRGSIPWGLFGLVVLGIVLVHLFANTANDYFDWRDGTDQLNVDYIVPFTGGSRSIELGLVTPAALLRLSLVLLVLAVAVGAAVLRLRPEAAPAVAVVGLLGALLGLFYTAPPVRLAARKGLGELAVGLAFGPLLTLGTGAVLRGALHWADALYGIPPGLLTTAILWMNEFPDIEGDRAAGKLNLVVVLGWRRARWGYVLLLVGALGAAAGLVAAGLASPWALALAGGAPFAWRAVRILFRTREPAELRPACAATILLQLTAGLLFAAGLAAGGL